MEVFINFLQGFTFLLFAAPLVLVILSTGESLKLEKYKYINNLLLKWFCFLYLSAWPIFLFAAFCGFLFITICVVIGQTLTS